MSRIYPIQNQNCLHKRNGQSLKHANIECFEEITAPAAIDHVRITTKK